MAPRQEKKIIEDQNGGSHEYYCIQKPAMQGEVLKFKIGKILGPCIKELKSVDIKALRQNEGLALEVFGNVLGDLFERNDPEELALFLQKLILGMTRDGERIDINNFDQIYTDNTAEMYKACFFMLSVNFGSFFAGLKLGEAPKEAKNLAE